MDHSTLKHGPIARLANELVQVFDRDAKGTRAAQLLAAYATTHDDWRAFARFSPERYTRNLVARNRHFEMLVLCWSAGQSSPIHNHAGQDCWMAVLDGEIAEVHYRVSSAPQSGSLAEGGMKLFTRGRVAFINDDIALHRVAPAAGDRGVTLHLYSKPIDVCNVYDEATGRVETRKLEYFSVPTT